MTGIVGLGGGWGRGLGCWVLKGKGFWGRMVEDLEGGFGR